MNLRDTALLAGLSLSLSLAAPTPAAAEGGADSAAAAPPPPCSAPEFRQLDFWLGTWDLTWGEDGRGTNVITREFGDCVVRESFAGGGFEGGSWSVWVPALGIWKQTWVDDTGSYLEFTGGREGDRFVLSREAPENPKVTHQRMIFRDIAADSLVWDWEASPDGGETWELRWSIRYARRK